MELFTLKIYPAALRSITHLAHIESCAIYLCIIIILGILQKRVHNHEQQACVCFAKRL